MSDNLPSFMFKKLTREEEAKYRKWARELYKSGEPINAIWHPVVKDECNKINLESGAYKLLTVGELFQKWREAYKAAYGHYPRIKVIE